MKNVVIILSILFSCMKASGLESKRRLGLQKLISDQDCEVSSSSSNSLRNPSQSSNKCFNPKTWRGIFCNSSTALTTPITSETSPVADLVKSEQAKIKDEFNEIYLGVMTCLAPLDANLSFKEEVNKIIKTKVDLARSKQSFDQWSESSLKSNQAYRKRLDLIKMQLNTLKSLLDLVQAQNWSQVRNYLNVNRLDKALEMNKILLEENSFCVSEINQVSELLRIIIELKEKTLDSINQDYRDLKKCFKMHMAPNDMDAKTKLLKGKINCFINLKKIHKQILLSDGLSLEDIKTATDKVIVIKNILEFSSESNSQPRRFSEAHIKESTEKTMKEIEKILVKHMLTDTEQDSDPSCNHNHYSL